MCVDCCAECAEGIARTFLYCTNLLVFLSSAAVLGLSVWFYVDAPSFVSIFSTVGVNIDLYNTTCILLIVASVFIIVVTFFGCCGAARDNRCMLWTYFVFVAILLVGMGVGAYFIFSGNTDTLKQPFLSSLETYDPSKTDNPSKALVNAWDDFQQDYKCCGVNDYKDWREFNDYYKLNDPNNNNNNNYNYNGPYSGGSFGYNTNNGQQKPGVPKSCCDASQGQQSVCQTEMTSSSGLYNVGCFDPVVNEIDKHSTVIGIVAIAVFVALLVNGVIAIYMATCGFHSTRPRYRYGRAATS